MSNQTHRKSVRKRLKAGFHMIADDRESQIADPRKFCDRLRLYGNPFLRSFAIVCDRLRSFAILRSYGNQSSAICDRNVSHNNLILTQMIQHFLATKPECSFMFVTVLSETRSSLSSVWKAPSFCLLMKTQNRCFLRF